MTDAAEQSTLDLGEYRGKAVTQTKVKLLNASDGFDPSTSMDNPQVYEIGERLVLAVEVVVEAHQPKAIDLDDEDLKLLLIQSFRCGTMAVIPRKAAAKQLDAAVKAKADAEKAKEAAKPKKKAPVKRGHLRSVGESLEEALQGAAETEDGYTDTDPNAGLDPEVST